MIFDYYKVHLKGKLLREVLDKDIERENAIQTGSTNTRFRGREVCEFIETYAKKNYHQNYDVKMVKQEDFSQKINEIDAKLKAIDSRQYSAVNNVNTNTKSSQRSNVNKGNDSFQSKFLVHSGGPRYKEAVKMLYRQFPIDSNRTTIQYIDKWVDTGNKKFKNSIPVRPVKPGSKPNVIWHGDKYEPDSPPFNGPIFKIQGTRSFLTYEILLYLSDKCIACGLKTCFDPYGKHCPMKMAELSWSICKNCETSFHKTSQCRTYIKEKN